MMIKPINLEIKQCARISIKKSYSQNHYPVYGLIILKINYIKLFYMALLLMVKIGSFFALKESLLTVLNKKIFE